MKNKKVLRTIIIVIVTLLILFVAFVVADNMAYNARYKKENSLELLVNDKTGQKFYVLGTIHGNHFNKSNDYSLADLQSVIETINPSLILLEYRPEIYEQYNSIDGPAEMIFAFTYSKEKNIPVKGIDYWQISENAQSNSTTKERDDAIFDNIINSASEDYHTILIVVGRDHLELQEKRFLDAGYTKNKITDINIFFANADPDNFSYPVSMVEEIDKKADYYDQNIMEEIITGIPNSDEKRDEWKKNAEDMVDYLNNELKPLVEGNLLFDQK